MKHFFLVMSVMFFCSIFTTIAIAADVKKEQKERVQWLTSYEAPKITRIPLVYVNRYCGKPVIVGAKEFTRGGDTSHSLLITSIQGG